MGVLNSYITDAIDTKGQMILDVFIPSLSIAVEYHGHQHYFDHFSYGTVEERKIRDEEKKLACQVCFHRNFIDIAESWHYFN